MPSDLDETTLTHYVLYSAIKFTGEINECGDSEGGHYMFYKYDENGNFEKKINDNDVYNEDDTENTVIYLYKKQDKAGGGNIKNYREKYLKYKSKYLHKKQDEARGGNIKNYREKYLKYKSKYLYKKQDKAGGRNIKNYREK